MSLCFYFISRTLYIFALLLKTFCAFVRAIMLLTILIFTFVFYEIVIHRSRYLLCYVLKLGFGLLFFVHYHISLFHCLYSYFTKIMLCITCLVRTCILCMMSICCACIYQCLWFCTSSNTISTAFNSFLHFFFFYSFTAVL